MKMKVSHGVGLILLVHLMMMVSGQQYIDDESSDYPIDEIQAIYRILNDPQNYQYGMHRKALSNAFDNLMADYNAYETSQESDEKRSIATLAKNGQLPASQEPETVEDEIEEEDENGHKRNLASMARSGMMGGSGKRNIQSLARQWQYVNGKRNIGSVLRNNNMFPGPGKRNIASLARYGGYNGKRNIGTLARDWSHPRFSGAKYMDSTDGKRNIQSMKNQIKGGRRKKRDVLNGEALEPVMQNGPIDYDELLQSLNENYLHNEKRYLEEQEPTESETEILTSIDGYQKRHIGAMARSGWMPFRPTLSRFSRSGRTSDLEKIVESYFPQDLRARPAPIQGLSCKRCDISDTIQQAGVRGQLWGPDLKSTYGSGRDGISSQIRTRSGARSPRVTAMNWREQK